MRALSATVLGMLVGAGCHHRPPPNVAAAPFYATCTDSGLCYRVLRRGSGRAHPHLNDTVEVEFTGWTADGQVLDSTANRDQRVKFAMKGVIPGWQEGLVLMTAGQKSRLWIPSDLAYAGRLGKPQGMLVFDVELVSIISAPPPIPAPPDVAAPPANATRTPSGLAWLVLREGTGMVHPSSSSKVTADFTGWTTDGRMFDSTVVRGKPFTAKVTQVIPGWQEALSLMVVGAEARFWIPAKLAYGDHPTRPGAPAGMLVFEIRLLEVADAPRP